MLGLVIYFSVDAATNRLFQNTEQWVPPSIMRAPQKKRMSYAVTSTDVKFGVGALVTEYPIRGGQFLKSILITQGKLTALKIVSDLVSSGYFIWTGYPEWKIYYDPRLEVYGDEFLVTYLSVLSDYGKFKQADAQYGFDAVVLSFMENPASLILQLTSDPDWSLVYMDGHNVIFLKNKPELAPIIAGHRVDISKGFTNPVPPDLEGKYLARERYCRGYLLLKFGHPELALPELEDAVKNWPDYPDMNFSLGKTLNLLQRYREAKPFLEKANRLQPGFSPFQIQLARAYARTGESEQAIQLYKQVLKEYPKEIIACMELAKTYGSISKSSDAHQQWQNCWGIYQTNPEFFKPYAEEILRGLNEQGE
jgi:tetratricopeptide (TPR) repeat protein